MRSGKWESFEDRVRDLAGHIYGRPCSAQKIGGVNVDGVVIIDSEVSIFIEMTIERSLGKVRTDVEKLRTAKSAAFSAGVMARCFCIVNGSVTTAMKEAADPHHIRVLSIDEFTRQQFFDFDAYKTARTQAPFGSSINPLTGEADETEYVSVKYLVDGRKGDIGPDGIADFLRNGKNVILLGEYGSGKSRCIREVFKKLSESAHEQFCYPVAIDLRKSWGLRQKGELIRRHFHDLGLDHLESNAIRAFNAGSVAILVDGFDEIGSQSWSSDSALIKVIRAKALEGVKDIVLTNKGGTLVAGREHYFTSPDEMFSALGMKPNETIVLRSKNEFSDTELLEYFRNRDIDVDIPEWLPRRPLICQTISDLAADQFDSMFGNEGDEIAFWNHFIKVLCERDARIHVSFDADTIFKIFVGLSRLTRSKSANVGPISLTEMQSAFEAATGAAPVEEASVMLQRLPSLGRISPESNDRQFVDIYILDGLRGKDIVATCCSQETEYASAISGNWVNALDDLGQRVLSADVTVSEKTKLDFARKANKAGNKIFASDIVASLMRKKDEIFSFEGLQIDNGDFLVLALDERAVSNLAIYDSYIGELILPPNSKTSIVIERCVTPKVSGISSVSALPRWIKDLEAEQFESVASVSRIRKIGLSPAQVALITIVRKTFFQKGAGRKEEALLRGLGKIGSSSLTTKIINMMLTENLLTKFRGNEGTVYSPQRAYTGRMQKMLDELGGSNDPLWSAVSKL